tara:strand:+ start:429 stop:548 length:120 start_codon:yes stop_codon:yes gene_type:complete
MKANRKAGVKDFIRKFSMAVSFTISAGNNQLGFKQHLQI